MYALELLHPGWFGRRAYRTYAGIYATFPNAIAATNTNGEWWRQRTLTIGHYEYLFWECHCYSEQGAWWRVTEEMEYR